jgi:hypothetical protein
MSFSSTGRTLPTRVANIIAIRDKLREEGFEPIIVADAFPDRITQFPEARERVIRLMIVQDEVVRERRTRRRPDE